MTKVFLLILKLFQTHQNAGFFQYIFMRLYTSDHVCFETEANIYDRSDTNNKYTMQNLKRRRYRSIGSDRHRCKK